MNAWQVGLSTGCFYRTSIFEVLESIRDSTISVVEICSHRTHLDYHNEQKVRAAAACLRKFRIQPFSFHAPFADYIDIASPDSGTRRDSVAEMLFAVRAAAALGAPHFVIHPGPEREGDPDSERHLAMLKNCADSLRSIAAECDRHGIKLLLENMLPHLFLGDAADLRWLMSELAPENPGFCLDTGHAHLGHNLHRLIQLFSEELTMVHAADNRGLHDDHLPPGKGSIDWPELLVLLRDLKFRGVFILELAGDTGAGKETILAEALKARGFIEQIVQGSETGRKTQK
ncbi:MAG: sugar phosphate isomerase/epimerase family protein [Desulfurivibrionaceae bacterium]